MLGAFYMFRTSCVHHQDDHLYCSFVRYVFSTEITVEGYIKYQSIKSRFFKTTNKLLR